MRPVIITCLFLLLGPCAYEDLKKKRINGYLLLLHGIAGIILRVYRKEMVSILLSILPGVYLLFMSVCTRKKIGIGDGLLFFVLGLYLEVWDVLWLLIFSLVLSSLYGTGKWILKRDKNGIVMPFVPFVFIAFLVSFILEVVSFE